MKLFNDMDKLLTIAIAAYNKEKELPKCLDSITVSKDLMEKVEVLVINDGSKDQTYAIAKEYEKRYPGCIYAIDQTNGNYGKVMNNALSLATGKYFKTLDADDWYDTNAYELFLHVLQQTDADVIFTEKVVHLEKTKEEFRDSLGAVVTGTDMPLEEAVKQFDAFKQRLNVHHLTYKTAMVKQSKLKWIEGICYTDTLFDFWPLPLVKTVRFEKLPVYVYLVGIAEQSMAPANIRKNHSHFVKVASAMIPYFCDNYDPQAPYFLPFKTLMHQILYCVFSDLLYGDENKKEILRIYDMLQPVPEFQKELKEITTLRGCKYLASVVDNRFNFKLFFLRILKKYSF